MNNKAFIDLDEINWVFLGLAILGGMLAFFVANRVPDVSKIIPVLSGIATIAVIYFYLTLTD